MASYRAKLPAVSSGGAVIKSVQRYTTTLTGANLTKIVNLTTPVVLSKSFVRSLKIYTNSSTAAYGAGAQMVTAELSANSVTITRTTNNNTSDLIGISFEVVEFESGVSVQRGVTSVSTTSATVPIATVNSSKSFCESSFRGGGTQPFAYVGYIEALGDSAITISREYFAQINIAWQVVTYV